MIQITAKDVKAGLTALVEEEGEGHVYEPWMDTGFGQRCTYVKDGEGDCAVGRYLISKGVPASRLEEFDNQQIASSAWEVLEVLNGEGVLEYTARASRMLDDFQSWQDARMAWGSALSETLSSHGLDGDK